ncbi:MAG: S1C family serine protease [Mangrovibacterium sp.]
MDKREFEAKVIGTDEPTDIALLKINADNLPTIKFGNSEMLKLGEWVLAVGNPFKPHFNSYCRNCQCKKPEHWYQSG